MKKKTLSFLVLLGALIFAFSAICVAADTVKDDKMSKESADFKKDAPKSDPIVQTTDGKMPAPSGESIKDDKMSRDGADFKKDSAKTDPVVQTTDGKMPVPSGESVKDDGMNKQEAK